MLNKLLPFIIFIVIVLVPILIVVAISRKYRDSAGTHSEDKWD